MTPIPLLVPQYIAFDFTKARAVRVIVQGHLQCITRGHGNRSDRRKASLASAREQAAWFDAQGGLAEADVDAYAIARGEVVVPQHAVHSQP